MKKICVTLLAVMLLITGCSQKEEPNTIRDGKSLQDVVDAVDAAFHEKYGYDSAVVMGWEIDAQTLEDFYDITPDMVDQMAGSYSMNMVNSDTFVAIKAKEGQIDNVIAGLEKRKTDLANQYEFYNVSGSYDRVLAGEVYRKGDYAFLIIVGQAPEDDSSAYDFPADVAMTKRTIDSMFY